MIAPQLIDQKSRILSSCRLFPAYKDLLLELTGLPRLFPHYIHPGWKMPYFDHSYEKTVDQPETTCVMVSRKTLDTIGFMDEQFPIFFNDVDWCHRFRENGWDILFYPKVKVMHKKGSSVYAHRIPMIWKSHQGFYRYFRKWHCATWGQRILNQIILFLLIITAVLRSIIHWFFNKGK